MIRLTLLAVTCALMAGCSSKVLVKKDSCKEVFGGALLECEKVSR